MFPVFVMARDSGEVSKYESIEAMQVDLEEIDVENDEYAAWDRDGRPLELLVQGRTALLTLDLGAHTLSHWLALEPAAHKDVGITLLDALTRYAHGQGMPQETIATLSADPLARFDEIASFEPPSKRRLR